MLKWFLSRWISKFERTWNYDASYLRDVLDADSRALMAFSRAAALSNYRKDVPPAAYCAAGLAGTMAEDCGPCTQLVLDMAQRQGVDPETLRAIVARDFTAMPFEVALPARGSAAPFRQARPRVACFRHDRVAPISDIEIRARARSRLHAAHYRR